MAFQDVRWQFLLQLLPLLGRRVGRWRGDVHRLRHRAAPACLRLQHLSQRLRQDLDAAPFGGLRRLRPASSGLRSGRGRFRELQFRSALTSSTSLSSAGGGGGLGLDLAAFGAAAFAFALPEDTAERRRAS